MTFSNFEKNYSYITHKIRYKISFVSHWNNWNLISLPLSSLPYFISLVVCEISSKSRNNLLRNRARRDHVPQNSPVPLSTIFMYRAANKENKPHSSITFHVNSIQNFQSIRSLVINKFTKNINSHLFTFRQTRTVSLHSEIYV